MVGLDLSESVKLAVIWLINPSLLLRSKPNLGTDLSYVSFLLQVLYIELFFLHIEPFWFFYARMNKP